VVAHSIRLLIASLIWLGFSVASAEGPRKAMLERSHLSGDWGGLRTRLLERGLVPFASYTTGFWSNLRGGLDPGVRYEGFADWGLDADLETLIGWRGGGFHIDWQSYHGGQPSERLVGPFFLNTVSGLEAEESIRFYEIFLEQRAFGDRLRAKAGQLALDEDFMISEHAQLFRNAIFGEFVTSAISATVAVYPLAAPGVYVEVEPVSGWWMRMGAATGDPGDDERDNYGFDWSFSSSGGATIFSEIVTHQRPFGLSGSFTAGVATQTGDINNFENGDESDGVNIFYAMIDQTVYEASSGSDERGFELGVFLRGAVPAQSDRTALDWQINGGLELRQPIPGRQEDSLGLGFAYIDFAQDYLRSVRASGLRAKSPELLFELTYRAQVTGWLSLQPDLQYFVDPHIGRRDALAVGLSAVIEL